MRSIQLACCVTVLFAILPSRAVQASFYTFASANATPPAPATSDTDVGALNLTSFAVSQDGMGGDGVGRATLNPGILTASAHGCGVVSGGSGQGYAEYYDVMRIASDSLPLGTPLTLTFSVAMAGSANGSAPPGINNFAGGSAEGSFLVAYAAGSQSVAGSVARNSAGANSKTGMMATSIAGKEAGETQIVVPGLAVGDVVSVTASIYASAVGGAISEEVAEGAAAGSLLYGLIPSPGVSLISEETGLPFPGGEGVSAGGAVDVVPPNPHTLIPQFPEPATAVLLVVGCAALAQIRRRK